MCYQIKIKKVKLQSRSSNQSQIKEERKLMSMEDDEAYDLPIKESIIANQNATS